MKRRNGKTHHCLTTMLVTKVSNSPFQDLSLLSVGVDWAQGGWYVSGVAAGSALLVISAFSFHFWFALMKTSQTCKFGPLVPSLYIIKNPMLLPRAYAWADWTVMFPLCYFNYIPHFIRIVILADSKSLPIWAQIFLMCWKTLRLNLNVCEYTATRAENF